MRRSFTLALVLAVAAAGRADPLTDKLKAAREDTRTGNHLIADQILAEALKEYPATSPKQRAEVHAQRLDNLIGWQQAKIPPASELLIDVYQQVLSDSDLKGTAIWRRAGNNLGIRYLTDGQPKRAVETFRDLFAAGDPPADSAYLFQANYARALELTGDAAGAAERNLKSLTAKPQYGRAAEGLVRALIAMPATNDRAKIVEAGLTVKGLPAQTLGTMTTDLLTAWAGGPAADPIWTHLARYYATLPVTVGRFVEVEHERLKRLPPSVRGREIEEQLRAAYTEPAAELRNPFPSGSSHHWEQVLKVAGDGFRDRASGEGKKAEAEAAYRRYRAAFDADRRYLDAARAVVAILVQKKTELDRDGNRLNEFAFELFNEKSDLYRQARTRADYLSLLSTHVLLAELYEAEPRAEKGGYQTAHRQWRMALRAEWAIRGVKDDEFPIENPVPDPDRSYLPSPEIRFRLADSLRKAKKQREAVPYYREALDLALSFGSTEQAGRVLKTIDQITRAGEYPAGDSATARLSGLLGRLDSHPVVWNLPVTPRTTALAFVQPVRNGPPLLVSGSGDRTDWWGLKPNRSDPVASWAEPGTRMAATEGGLVHLRLSGEFADVVVKRPGQSTYLLHRSVAGVSKLSASPAGHFAAALDVDGMACVWDAATNDTALVAGAWSDRKSRGVALSPDGDVLLLLFADNIKLYSLSKKTELAELNEAAAAAAAVSPDGRRIAVIRDDGAVVVRQVFDDRKSVSLVGLAGRPTAIMFDPKGMWLITLGPDTTVRLWDPVTGTEAVRFGYPARPTAVSISPDGRYLATAVPQPDGGTAAVVRELRR
jgi:tetratricopeptide (TPR) repeat protein